MKRYAKLWVLVLLSVPGLPGCSPAGWNDPYLILQKYYNAIGGIRRVKAEKTRYYEGTITIVNPGYEGTIKIWEKLPCLSRSEVDFGEVSNIEAQNAVMNWNEDWSGRIHIADDSLTLGRKRIDQLLNTCDHANRRSKNFRLSYAGTDSLGSDLCRVIRILNTQNSDTTYQYFSVDNDYLVKQVRKQDEEIDILFADFREYDGIIRSFHWVIEYPAYDQQQIIEIHKIETNLDIPDSIFQAPELADYK